MNLLLEYLTPSLVTTKSFIPRSIPTFALVFCNGSYSTSERMETKYFPLGVIDIVIFFTLPVNGLCSIILMPFLNFGMKILPSATEQNWGTLKLPPFFFALNLGNLVLPLKILLYAVSRCLKDCFNVWEFTSLIQEYYSCCLRLVSVFAWA